MKRQKKTQLLCNILVIGFLLGIHRGQLALWRDQDPIPYKILPYPASLLPEDAREDLKSGIPIDSLDDLKELLEKYLP